MSEREVKLDDLMPIIREQLALGNSVTFSPRGISMLPMLRQGKDTVTLSPIEGRLEKYDLPLYQREDGKYVLHRIVKVGETYTCIGDNQFVLESGLTDEQMIAVVTKFTRGSHQHSINELSYKIYCRIWHISCPLRHLFRRGKNFTKRILGR